MDYSRKKKMARWKMSLQRKREARKHYPYNACGASFREDVPKLFEKRQEAKKEKRWPYNHLKTNGV